MAVGAFLEALKWIVVIPCVLAEGIRNWHQRKVVREAEEMLRQQCIREQRAEDVAWDAFIEEVMSTEYPDDDDASPWNPSPEEMKKDKLEWLYTEDE